MRLTLFVLFWQLLNRGSSVVEIHLTVSVFFHCVCTYNCATTKLVLLPYLAPGSKSLLPQKNEFLGLYCSNQLC